VRKKMAHKQDSKREGGEDGNIGMSNSFLEQIGYKLNSSYFEGVFSCDHLKLFKFAKNNKQARSVGVVNLMPSHIKNGHFATWVIDREKNKLFVFDSLLLTNRDPVVLHFLEKVLEYYKGMKLVYPQVKYQKENSEGCGLFALAFVASQSKCCYKSLSRFLAMYDAKKKEKNEQISLKYILSHIKNCTNVK